MFIVCVLNVYLSSHSETNKDICKMYLSHFLHYQRVSIVITIIKVTYKITVITVIKYSDDCVPWMNCSDKKSTVPVMFLTVPQVL